MVRGRQAAGGCSHVTPVVMEPIPEGRVARCFVCGRSEPARPNPGRALAALRDEARRSLREAG